MHFWRINLCISDGLIHAFLASKTTTRDRTDAAAEQPAPHHLEMVQMLHISVADDDNTITNDYVNLLVFGLRLQRNYKGLGTIIINYARYVWFRRFLGGGGEKTRGDLAHAEAEQPAPHPLAKAQRLNISLLPARITTQPKVFE